MNNYFAPPQIIQTEVFAEVPQRYRVKGKHTEWARVNRPGNEISCFLEGPSFDRSGNLYVVDIPYGRIFRVSPKGDFDLVAEYDGEPNGLKIHKDGRIFIADYKNGLMQLDPQSGDVTPYLERTQTESFKGLNDLFFASNGDLYFTDQGQTGMHDPSGRVYRLTASGQLQCLLRNVPSPNGLVLNAAENVLFVAATRSNQIWRVPLTSDGGVTKVSVFVQMTGAIGPDGMAFDDAGNLVVAHAGMGCLWVFSPKGEPLYRVQSCRGEANTNVAYGGPDNKSLYITESESGSILMARMPVAGRKMFSHL
jgi:gluconolactonase